MGSRQRAGRVQRVTWRQSSSSLGSSGRKSRRQQRLRWRRATGRQQRQTQTASGSAPSEEECFCRVGLLLPTLHGWHRMHAQQPVMLIVSVDFLPWRLSVNITA